MPLFLVCILPQLILRPQRSRLVCMCQIVGCHLTLQVSTLEPQMQSLLPMLLAGLHACDHIFSTKGSGCISFQASLQVGMLEKTVQHLMAAHMRILGTLQTWERAGPVKQNSLTTVKLLVLQRTVSVEEMAQWLMCLLWKYDCLSSEFSRGRQPVMAMCTCNPSSQKQASEMGGCWGPDDQQVEPK